MLLQHLGKIQKGLLVTLLFVIALNIYYESGLVYHPNTLNPYPDNRLNEEEKNWVSFAGNQFKENGTEVKFFEEGNFWGMTYYVTLKNNNYPNPIKEIEFYDTTSDIKGELTNTQYKDALLRVDTSILCGKYVTFSDDAGNTMVVRTNPFDYVYENNFQIPTMLFVSILTLVMGTSLLPGAVILGLATCGLVALTGLYYYLVILIPLVAITTGRVLMVTLANNNKFFDFKNRIAALVIFTIVMAYYSFFQDTTFKWITVVANVIISSIYAGLGMYLFHLSINLAKTLYIFIKYPTQYVVNLSATNLITNINREKPTRQLPKYYADLVIDDAYSFTKVDIDGALYGSIKFDKPFNDLKYKTDGKSFILYY
ncbi:hypothetical protein [Myroides profundi]|uniref:Uncharacterized protein n=1 Tax=Myroides profundi TaxID=480520 RepID=A0AAJ4W0C9_MYRPR|nr:hypothetical protein [Myroides profundi]AJH13633.1 hypothetical protein MPR_0421 [Myroides profundi]SEP91130.1 hypothetical protein SAMN04488089_10169 [Myroides profundi]